MITIHSNGSKWAGEEPDSIDKLLEVLASHVLDRRMEYREFGPPFRETAKPGDKWATPGTVRFFGNFLELSHVFSIDTDEPELIGRLTAAIDANMARDDYKAQPKPLNSYEQKQERRRERLEARADRLRQEGNARINRGRQMAEAIPFGQPILVGHHSEKRDRNYRAKIHNNFDKGYHTLQAADKIAARAASVGNGGVSSDDPEAVRKLKEQLEKCEKSQTRMIAANKALRKGDDAALHALGFNDAAIARLKEPDFCGRTGFADFETKNNGANIRRLKARIAELERNSTRETKETERQDGLRIVENAEENRLQVFFPSKPSVAARDILKRNGFRWSPTEGAWQRQLNNRARWVAEQTVAEIDKL